MHSFTRQQENEWEQKMALQMSPAPSFVRKVQPALEQEDMVPWCLFPMAERQAAADWMMGTPAQRPRAWPSRTHIPDQGSLPQLVHTLALGSASLSPDLSGTSWNGFCSHQRATQLCTLHPSNSGCSWDQRALEAAQNCRLPAHRKKKIKKNRVFETQGVWVGSIAFHRLNKRLIKSSEMKAHLAFLFLGWQECGILMHFPTIHVIIW